MFDSSMIFLGHYDTWGKEVRGARSNEIKIPLRRANLSRFPRSENVSQNSVSSKESRHFFEVFKNVQSMLKVS